MEVGCISNVYSPRSMFKNAQVPTILPFQNFYMFDFALIHVNIVCFTGFCFTPVFGYSWCKNSNSADTSERNIQLSSGGTL